jgi:hypothetical protein
MSKKRLLWVLLVGIVFIAFSNSCFATYGVIKGTSAIEKYIFKTYGVINTYGTNSPLFESVTIRNPDNTDKNIKYGIPVEIKPKIMDIKITKLYWNMIQAEKGSDSNETWERRQTFINTACYNYARSANEQYKGMGSQDRIARIQIFYADWAVAKKHKDRVCPYHNYCVPLDLLL